MTAEFLQFHYRFTFPDGRVKEFDIRLSSDTLELLVQRKQSYPEWTALEFKQCPNCTLTPEQSPRCPVAVGMLDVIDFFKDATSSEQVDVEITTPERTYKKKTALSNGVSALIGIQMVTSGCPVLDKLRPMVRTHLPFANLKETMYRTLAMYMLAQYFRTKRGEDPDFSLDGLSAVLEDMRTVNRSFCERLYEICEKDANLNALVHLDCFADNTSFFIKKKGLDEIEKIFSAYFIGESAKPGIPQKQ